MTGEITLRGRVLPIGGLKEKVLGAHRAGIKVIIIPKGNEADIEDVPEEVRNTLEFHPVETLSEVLRIALVPVEPGEQARPLEMQEVAVSKAGEPVRAPVAFLVGRGSCAFQKIIGPQPKSFHGSAFSAGGSVPSTKYSV